MSNSEQKRVLIISPRYQLEAQRGISNITNSIIKDFRQKGYIVDILMDCPSNKFNKRRSISLNLRNKLNLSVVSNQLFSNINLNYSKLHYFKVILKTLVKSLFSKVFVEVKNDESYLKELIMKKENKELLSSIDTFICLSFFNRSMYLNWLAPYRYLVLQNILKYKKYDFIYIENAFNLYGKLKCKTVTFIHDIIPMLYIKDEKSTEMFLHDINYSIKYSDSIIVNSNSTARIVRDLDYQNDIYLYNYIDTALLKFRDNIKNFSNLEDIVLKKYKLTSKKYLLYLGSFDRRKNVDILLDSFELASRELKKFKLLLVGANREQVENYNRLINNSKYKYIKKNVIVLGYVDTYIKFLLMRNSFVFLFPSLYEGLGLMAIESVALGTPVLASKVGGLEDLGNSSIIYFSDYENYVSIASDIINIYKNIELYNKYSVPSIFRNTPSSDDIKPYNLFKG